MGCRPICNNDINEK